MIRSTLCSLALGLLAAGCGSTERVHGVVTDERTGDPLPGATVRLGDDEVTTDDQGFFWVESDDDEGVLVIEAEGYDIDARRVDFDEFTSDTIRHDARLERDEDAPAEAPR